MKKYVTIVVLLLFAASFAGCAAAVQPLTGSLYSNISAPLLVGPSDEAPTKIGTASATSILGIIATGDASIEAAAKAGGITNIHHVDYNSESTLGIIATYTVTVYGN